MYTIIYSNNIYIYIDMPNELDHKKYSVHFESKPTVPSNISTSNGYRFDHDINAYVVNQ